MAWEWSHSAEGISNARRNLSQVDQHTMGVILAEWNASYKDVGGSYHLDIEIYNAEVGRLTKLPTDVLAAEIWGRAERLRTCNNGGHEAWLCPFGCYPHTVSFELEPGA